MAALPMKTPAALGFRMPAEWEPQAAVWLSWPHNRKTWPGHFRPIPEKFAEIVATISRFEEVRINIAKALQPRAWSLITRAKADLAKVEFYHHPTNDAWCRDHGPIFVKHVRTGEVAITDWKHNAWGGKYPPFDKDNTIPPKIAKALKLRRFVISTPQSMIFPSRVIFMITASSVVKEMMSPVPALVSVIWDSR